MTGRTTMSVDVHRAFKANQQLLQVLEASKAVTEDIFDELPVILVLIDERDRILKLNLMGQIVFGRDEGQVIGKELDALLDAQAVSLIKSYYSTSREIANARLSFQNEILSPSGRRAFFGWDIQRAYLPKLRPVL